MVVDLHPEDLTKDGLAVTCPVCKSYFFVFFNEQGNTNPFCCPNCGAGHDEVNFFVNIKPSYEDFLKEIESMEKDYEKM